VLGPLGFDGVHNMTLLAIDPGTTESGFVVLDTDTKKVLKFGKINNEAMRVEIEVQGREQDACMTLEQIKSYGNAMGDTTIETCVWIGRFIERWPRSTYTLIPRKTICGVICHNAKAKDNNIRRAMLDKYLSFTPASELGGGSEPAVGTKAKPGPLYGVSADVFSALALGWTWCEMYGAESQDFLK
jgi:hypothetical protein